MDTTNELKCDNGFCVALGFCVSGTDTSTLLYALQAREARAYMDGWADALEDADEQAEEEFDAELSLEVLADAVGSVIEDIGDDFGVIQVWADGINGYIDNLQEDIKDLSREADSEAVLLEAISVRLVDLEEDNKNLWEALLSKD